MTTPPGEGWAAQLSITASKQDGRGWRWTEDATLSPETAIYTLTPPIDEDGTTTKLVVRVFYVNIDGRRLGGPILRSRFVVADQGQYLETEEGFDSAIIDGVLADPHDGMLVDEEVAR